MNPIGVLWSDVSTASGHCIHRKEDLQIVLTGLFDVLYPVGIVFGGVALVASVARSLSHGWHATLVLHIIMYSLAVVLLLIRRRVPVMAMFVCLLGLIATDVIHSLYTMGLAGGGLVSLAFLCAFAGVFLGVRAGLIAVGAGLITVAFLGAAICTGLIMIRFDIAAHLTAPMTWITQTACFTTYILPLIITVNDMQKRLSQSLTESRVANGQLESEIARRKSVEDELRQSEAKYRNIFENTVEGIFQIAADGKILNANPALLRMTGYASLEDMIHSGSGPQDRFFVRLAGVLRFRRLLKAFEIQVRRKDGSALWVVVNARTVYDEMGQILYFEGTAEDVSKRKSAEMALMESETKYRTVVETSLVASYIVQDGLFRFVNTQFCNISGYSYDEIVDRLGPLDMVCQNQRQTTKENLEKRLNGEGPSDTVYELNVVRKDGRLLTVKLLGGSFIYRGRPAAFGTLIDVTKEVSLESQLRQSQKMEAIGTLAGGIAHDFNNILTALTGYGTLLDRKMESGDPLHHYVNQILSASQKATRLTQSLLAFARCQPISLKPQSINGTVQATEKLLRRLVTEDISLVTNLSSHDPVVMVDATQIDQILFNLVTNAADAMAKGGTLTIETEQVELDGAFLAARGFGEPGSYARLSVTDTGDGMDKKTMERIFDPFFTTKEVGRGTGLGLATVYGIVKQHGGYITVDSEPGKGTVFHIYFPIVKRFIEETNVESRSLRQGKGTVLVAEDSEDVRSFISEILDQQGYTVIEAVDGDDAVHKFVRHEAIVSLVVLDSIMPGKNGIEVYNAIKTMRPDIRTLFMSGYTTDLVLGKGVAGNEMDFIAKPLSPNDFLEKVGEILDR